MAGGVIAQALAWRWTLYLVGIAGLICAFSIWRAVEPKRGAFDQDHDNESAQDEVAAGHGSLGPGFWSAVGKLVKTRTCWILIAAFICSFFIVGAAMSWIPTM